MKDRTSAAFRVVDFAIELERAQFHDHNLHTIHRKKQPAIGNRHATVECDLVDDLESDLSLEYHFGLRFGLGQVPSSYGGVR